jgi:hypothetical protein
MFAGAVFSQQRALCGIALAVMPLSIKALGERREAMQIIR